MKKRSIFDRLAALEHKIISLLPCWSNDDDGFLAALGVDLNKYEHKNHDGSVGYDWLAALSDKAPDVWTGGDDSQMI